MQANDFEKSIRRKMEEFELVPKEEVWKQVSANIRKEDNNRRIFFWFLSGFLMLAGLAGSWFLNRDKSVSITKGAPRENKAPLKTGIRKTPEVVKNSDTNQQTAKSSPSITNGSDGKIPANHDRPATKKTAIKIKVQPVKKESSLPAISNKLQGSSVSSASNLNDMPPGKVLKEKSENLPPHKFLKTGSDQFVKNDSGKNGLINKDTKKDSSASIMEKKAAVKKVAKNWKIGFTAYAGISNNSSGLPLVFSPSSADYLSSSSPNQSSGAAGNTFLPYRLNYKTGLSFGLGIFTGKQFSKRFGLTAGADYHFYSARSTAGNKIDTAATFRDSALQSTAFVSNFYLGGQSGSFLNSWHLIELPVNLHLRLNKNKDNPVSFTAGVSPGFLIGSNALYVNSRERVIYEEKKQFHRFQLSAQAGLLFPLKTFKTFHINAGPVFKYGFTNLTKHAAATRQHLVFAGIKANINLK